jgi:hypothetical protein
MEESEICQRSQHSCHGLLCSGAAHLSGRITNSSKTKFTNKYTHLCDKFYKSVKNTRAGVSEFQTICGV